MIKKNSPFDLSLYAIIDQQSIRDITLADLTDALAAGGATIIQYRDKMSESRDFYDNALCVREITQKYNIPLIINDRLDIALAVKANGLHLGQTDLPGSVVRQLTSKEFIIGCSVSNWDEFENIDEAHYLGVGAIYPTKTKEDAEHSGLTFLKEVRAKTDLPLVGIGGINYENMEPVFKHGADGIAVVSALLHADDVAQETRKMRKAIDLLDT